MASPATTSAPNWVLRIGAVLGSTCYAALALGNGIDRMTADHPGLADKLPKLFASQAYESLATRAIDAGNSELALQIGRDAILAAPIEPSSAALLGSAQMLANQQKPAEASFRVAGKLGWRVPSTQAYWQMRAVVVSDYGTAALRTDALLRQDPDLLGTRQILDPVERNSAGRAALVARMRLNPPWLVPYATKIGEIPVDSFLQRMEVLELAARNGVVLGCEEIGPATTRLVQIGAFDQAQRIWFGHCRMPRRGELFDGALVSLKLDQPPSPFAWQLVGHNDVTIDLTPAGLGGGQNTGQRVTIASSASFPRRILSQMVVAKPGTYRLSWAAGSSDDQPAKGLRVSVTCTIDTNKWVEGQFDQPSKRWYADLAIAADCPGHWINFGILPGAGPVWLEAISLDRLGS